MENRTWRLLYTASFYVHRKNAKQACTLAHTSRVRVHTGKTYGGCNRGGSARGVRLPLSTPLRYQPWLDIINGNAIFSSAVQFRVPLSRIRSSILYADLSIPPCPSPTLGPRSGFSFSLSPSPFDPFIYLFPPRTSLRICYFVYFSLVPPTSPANEHPSRFPRPVFVVDGHERSSRDDENRGSN